MTGCIAHNPPPMKLTDFDYELPAELIAQHPPAQRGESRMLVVDGVHDVLRDAMFSDLPAWLHPGDLLVVNDTRVIKARLLGRKATGGQVEVLVERVVDERHALAMVSASHSPRAGSVLTLGQGLDVEVLGREGQFFHLRFPEGTTVFEALERHGGLPLPPYIERAPETDDESRYQTVYAAKAGAVAAPTAGLHFTEAMFDALAARGIDCARVTLHVGAGTFQPVRVEDVRDHVMHSEWYEIPPATVQAIERARARGGRVVAVGTTSLRALESAAVREGGLKAGAADTNLFIVPGYRFSIVDVLFTNFHLPKSTLLMLVSAFGGMAPLRRAYEHAVRNRYRFFSYGDAMLILRRAPEET